MKKSQQCDGTYTPLDGSGGGNSGGGNGGGNGGGAPVFVSPDDGLDGDAIMDKWTHKNGSPQPWPWGQCDDIGLRWRGGKKIRSSSIVYREFDLTSDAPNAK